MAEINAIQGEASKRGYRIGGSQLDVLALADATGKKEQVNLVYRRTSGLLHLTRSALSSRIVEHKDRFVVMPTSSLWAEVMMADLGARQFTIAMHSTAFLLRWETGKQQEALAHETEQRLDDLAVPIIARGPANDVGRGGWTPLS